MILHRSSLGVSAHLLDVLEVHWHKSVYTGRHHPFTHFGAGNGGPIPTEDSLTGKELHMESTEWVELFVREMMSASNIDDAKVRASRALEVLEKSICARAKEETARDVQQVV